MNVEEFIDKFQNVDFDFEGVNWWPLLKVQVAYQIHLKINATPNFSKVNPYQHKKCKGISIKDEIKLYWLHYQKTTACKNLVVTANHLNQPQGASNDSYNPFTAPFIHFFKKENISYLLYNVASNQQLMGYPIQLLKRKYEKKVRQAFDKNLEFQQQLKTLTTFLKTQCGQDFDLYNHLVVNIINNQVEYWVYRTILKKATFKNILLYCYYNNIMMAICRAAQSLNIKVIEYQHSQVTSNHFAYSNWSTISSKSIGFFPATIWVWRSSDAAYLKEQFFKLPALQCIVGGNLNVEMFKTENVKTESTNNTIKVLITLQGIQVPAFVMEVLSEIPNLIFYLRLHPRYPNDKEWVAQMKQQFGNQIEIEEANLLTLKELLNEVEYHLTYFSGSAIEADYFGVTNIIYGEKGYLTFQREIDAKKYLFIKNQEDLSEILTKKIKVFNDRGNSIDVEEKMIKQFS